MKTDQVVTLDFDLPLSTNAYKEYGFRASPKMIIEEAI